MNDTFLEAPPISPSNLVNKCVAAFCPSEDTDYHSYIHKKNWTLQNFSALFSGLNPDIYTQFLSRGPKNFSPSEIKKITQALTIEKSLHDDIEDIGKKLDKNQPLNICLEKIYQWIRLDDNNFWMSSWKFIAWAAMKNLSCHGRCLEALSLDLLEIYLEFQPLNTILRTKSTNSQEYHRAYFIKTMQEFIKIQVIDSTMTNQNLYHLPYVQQLLDRIAKLHEGNRYKKSTILQSWLPAARLQSIGRPKKPKPSS